MWGALQLLASSGTLSMPENKEEWAAKRAARKRDALSNSCFHQMPREPGGSGIQLQLCPIVALLRYLQFQLGPLLCWQGVLSSLTAFCIRSLLGPLISQHRQRRPME